MFFGILLLKWTKDFYGNMHHLFKEKLGDAWMNPRYDLINQLETYTNKPIKTILELGAGNGQFAVAAAERGYSVTVIELVPKAVEMIRDFAAKHGVEDRVTIFEGDFYEVDLQEQFDAVCYWDGFGIGSDADQHALLRRVSDWLKPGGQAFIDIYTPWYWAKAAGIEMDIGGIMSRYEFDAMGCRMINTWWDVEIPDQKTSQYLRCYSPADLQLLMKDLDFKLEVCDTGGEMDYEEMEYHPNVPLHRAMMNVAMLIKE